MPAKQKPGRNEVIRCPNCGEDYSVTYKRCPFCDEYAAEEEQGGGRSRRGGGKRVMNTRGGGYNDNWGPGRIIATVLSIGLIIAAVCIVITVLKPLISRGDPDPDTSVSPSVTSPSPDPGTTPTLDPDASPEPDSSASPEPDSTPTPSGTQTATGVSLNKSDVTLSNYGESFSLQATLSPAGSTGAITWASSDPQVASVDESGTVQGLSRGTADITATLPDGTSAACIVRCRFDAPAGVTTPPSGSSNLTLSKTDVTLRSAGERFTLTVSGTSSTPTFSSADTSVATVSGGGVVTAVAEGTTTVLVQVDGQTLSCIVRCNF